MNYDSLHAAEIESQSDITRRDAPVPKPGHLGGYDSFDALARAKRMGSPNYLACTPNERRRLGDRAADVQDFLLAGVGTVKTERPHPTDADFIRGYDDGCEPPERRNQD